MAGSVVAVAVFGCLETPFVKVRSATSVIIKKNESVLADIGPSSPWARSLGCVVLANVGE